VRVDEVEALAHEGLFVVEDHAGEVDEALGVDEEADRGCVGERGIEMSLGEGVDAVALAGLGVELDGVAEAGAAASGDADAEAAGRGGDALLGHGDADAFEGAEGDLDAFDRACFAFGGEDGGRRGGRDRGCGYGAFGGIGLEGDHGHRACSQWLRRNAAVARAKCGDSDPERAQGQNDNPKEGMTILETNCASGVSENPAGCLVGPGGGCDTGFFGDVVLLLPVADGGADGVFGEDRAVDFDRREREFFDDVGVGDRQGLGDGLALDPLGGERAGGDGRAAAEGLELGVLDDLGFGVDADLEAHDVAAFGRADQAGADFGRALVEGTDVAGMFVVVYYLVAVCHDVFS